MKALSLLEPWASLVMLRKKKIETRSWKTNYRGELLIHASASIRGKHTNIAWEEPFFSALTPVHRMVQGKRAIRYHPGCIIAKCRLVDCIKIPEPDDIWINLIGNTLDYNIGLPADSNEVAFGDYTAGRYAWILDKIEPLEKPIPAKGHLGLWDFPDELLP